MRIVTRTKRTETHKTLSGFLAKLHKVQESPHVKKRVDLRMRPFHDGRPVDLIVYEIADWQWTNDDAYCIKNSRTVPDDAFMEFIMDFQL